MSLQLEKLAVSAFDKRREELSVLQLEHEGSVGVLSVL